MQNRILNNLDINQPNFLENLVLQNNVKLFEAILAAYQNSSLTDELYRFIKSADLKSIAKLAAKEDKTEIINVVLPIVLKQFYNTTQQINYLNELLELAAETENQDVSHSESDLIDYLNDQIDNLEWQDGLQHTIQISEEKLTTENFISLGLLDEPYSHYLTLKGVILVHEYYKQKNDGKTLSKLLVAENERGLLKCLQLFAESNELSLNIFIAHEGHFIVAHCERYNNQLYVEFVDSSPSSVKAPLLIHSIGVDKADNNFLNQFIFYSNKERQQSGNRGCRIFMLKNLRLLEQSTCFAKELLDSKLTTNEKIKVFDIPTRVLYFHFPPRFMHLTSSFNQIMSYVQNDLFKEMANKTLRTKDGQPQNLLQWAFQSRNSPPHAKTPITITNKNTAQIEQGSEDKNVLKNNTIEYFESKYNAIVLELLKKFTQAQLKNIIDSVNPELATVDSVTHKIKMQNEEKAMPIDSISNNNKAQTNLFTQNNSKANQTVKRSAPAQGQHNNNSMESNTNKKKKL